MRIRKLIAVMLALILVVGCLPAQTPQMISSNHRTFPVRESLS